jgi:DNA polymerase
MNQEKQATYRALVVQRKTCFRCAHLGLTNPSAPGLSTFDADQIGPWTRWLGDLDADVMIIGQDWGDVDGFRRQEGLDNESATNRTLRELLAHVGIDVDPAPRSSQRSRVFLTNAALCLKQGGAQAPVHPAWFKNCAPAFLRPQIDLVQPRVVVTLGERAYCAVMREFELRPRTFRGAVEAETPVNLRIGTVLVPVYHCGQRTININRDRSKQFKDWLRVKAALDAPY